MIDPARIKRAARLRWERMNPGISWDNVREDAKAQMEESIAATATDLFPELDGDEPEAWLAPMDATGAMQADMRGAIVEWLPRGEVARPVTDQWQIGRDVYEAARDAHLREQTT